MVREGTKSEIESLISLLDDPDETVYQPVATRLKKLGEKVLPDLQFALYNTENDLKKKRLTNISGDINFNALSDQILNWCASGHHNITEILTIIARYETPDIQTPHVVKELEVLVFDVQKEMPFLKSPAQQVRTISQVLFDVHKFKPNVKKPFDPKNCMINEVFERKETGDIILAFIYMHIGEQLGIPLRLINFPRNTLVAYVDENENPGGLKIKSPKPIFYVNPFNKGTLLSEKDVLMFLENNHMPLNPKFYKPASIPEIVYRLLRFLAASYQNYKKQKQTKDVMEFSNILLNHFKFK